MKNQNRVKKTVFAALFVGIMAVVSQIYIPLGIPITFQVFVIALCGYVLGAKWGTASVAVYIISGVVGLPVFSGFKGGFSALFEMTGGFIIGFLPLVFLCGMAGKKKRKVKVIFSLLGLVLCHALGIMQFCLISKSNILFAVLTVSMPYIIKDTALLLAADIISSNIKERF